MRGRRAFIPGLKLGRMLFEEVGRSIVESVVTADAYAAGLLGAGSDVLGYDSERSTDHDWGPRFIVFLADDLPAGAAGAVKEALARGLPHEFHGYPVGFGDPDPADNGTRLPLDTTEGPVTHLIPVTTLGAYLVAHLGRDVRGGIGVMERLSYPDQRLLELTAGEVFHDPRGDLARVRGLLADWPRDVWLYRMACQWQRISQGESFLGRCADVGDVVGQRLVAARLVRDLVHLCFLQEKTCAPYDKWLGTALSRLRCAPRVVPLMEAVLSARSYWKIEPPLADLYRAVGEAHNALGVTGRVDPAPRPFFDRPWLVIRAERFANALLAAVKDETLRALPVRMGSFEQFIDCTDVIENVGMYRKVEGLYEQ